MGDGALNAPQTFRLQWGHAFVSVETDLVLRLLGLLALASMGPRFCKRGNNCTCAGVAAQYHASMGPRFCKRGNLPGTDAPPHLQPRHAFVSVETTVRALALPRSTTLQWGHAFVSVETCSALGNTPPNCLASMGPRFCKRGNWPSQRPCSKRNMLQWGHAFVSVETCSARQANSAQQDSFNGATLL